VSKLKTITELQYGDGAVKVIGKILVQETESSAAKSLKVEVGNLIAGVVITSEGKSLLSRSKTKGVTKQINEGLEMWEVELVIIPKRKYRRNKTETCFAALTLDQKMSGGWWSRENWKEKIFGDKGG